MTWTQPDAFRRPNLWVIARSPTSNFALVDHSADGWFWTAAGHAAWQAESCEAAKAAAESAVREYAAAILAALPARTVTEPTAEEVEETARALHAMEEKRRRLWRTWDYMDPTAHETYRSIARAAIAAGLDPRRLKEGT